MTLASVTPGASMVPLTDSNSKIPVAFIPALLQGAIEDTVTAHAGGTQASAFALSATKTYHHVTVCATAADSVSLPVLVVGENHFIFNSGAAACQVYGAGTSTINDIATATGVSIPAGSGCSFAAVSTGKWYSSGLSGTATADSDATVTFTDITTNNSSTSKHGFLKKLSNSATDYMDGTGAWSTPPSAAFDPSTACVLYDDFMGYTTPFTSIYDWTTTVNGTGATVIQSMGAAGVGVNHPGLLRCNLGTTTTGQADYGMQNNNAFLCGENGITFQTDLLVSALSDGTDTYKVLIGMHDGLNATPNTGIWFEYTHSVNSGKFTINCNNNGTTTTSNSLGTALVGNTWRRLSFIVNSAGTSVTFYENGSSVGTITTNLPIVGRFGPNINTKKSAGTTTRVIYVDYFYVALSMSAR